MALVLGAVALFAAQHDAAEIAWILVGLAALVALWTVITWEPVRRRTQSLVAALPVTFQIAWRGNLSAPQVDVEKGFLDFEKSWLEAVKAAAKTLEALTAEMNATNPKIQAHTGRLQRAVGASVDVRLREATRSAKVFDGHAHRMERLQATYRAQTQSMTANLVEMLKTTPTTSDLDMLPPVLKTTRDQMAASLTSNRTYRDTIRKIRLMRVSQAVNAATDRLINVLDRFAEDTEAVMRALTEAQLVIKKRWPKS